ncbi:MAG: asparagine synthase [Burkholderiales bacterium]|nr:asparagine synthase [Burkholderiales bacterium]
MCGIAGSVALAERAAAPPREALARMASALSHRGPDDSGVYRDARAGLAHARLSIIDPAGGRQPMAHQDRATWIVFNGEIFNFVELRAELEALGIAFRTRSDTEVILAAYREWGERAFERFNGQWALALWDSRERRLVLARDPMGICPLYLCEHAGRLYFASEVKAIFAADAAIPREFDPEGIDETFTFWSVLPPRSVFRGIGELRPGHVRVYESGKVRERAFWAPTYGGFTGSLNEAVESVRSAVEGATRLRMLRADVPVGSYLSGGLDSSLVAALGRRFAGDRFHTFSLRFEDAEYDETAYQRLMARELGAEHHEVVATRADIARVFPDVVRHAERPILRTAPAPLFLLSQLVRRHGIKVVLTGEGADEMFAGYDLFREGKVRRFWARDPGSPRRARLLERLYPWLGRSPVAQQAMARQFFGRNLAAHRAPGFAHDPRWQTTGALKRLLAPGMRTKRNAAGELLADLPEAFGSWTALAQDQYLECRTLLSGYLLSSQGDRMLMAHSVEGRFPFLDPGVMALANSLPPAYKLRVLDEKHVLKRAAESVVPREILARKKQPYRAPDAAALIEADYLEELLSESALRDAGVFSPQPVRHLLAKRAAHFSNTDNMALAGVLSTQILHHEFIACSTTT